MTNEPTAIKQSGQELPDDTPAAPVSVKSYSSKGGAFLKAFNPSFAVVGAASLAGAWVSIDKNFHKQLEKLGYFTELNEARERVAKLLSAGNPNENVLIHEKKHEADHVPNVYDRKFTQAIEEARKEDKSPLRAVRRSYHEFEKGIEHSLGIKNSIQKWNELESYYKNSIFVRFATLGSVAVGAIYYGLSQQHAMSHKLDQQIAAQNKTQR